MIFPLLISVRNLVPYIIIVFAAIAFTVIFYIYVASSVKELKTDKRDIELIDRLIYIKKEKTIKRQKIFRIIKNILFYTLLVIIIPFLAYAVIARIKGGSPRIGNTTIMVVGSGSMSFKNQDNPNIEMLNSDKEVFNYQFQYGDIIFVKKVTDVNELNQWDVMCFHDPTKNENIIHRIIEIKDEEIKKFKTCGDANNAIDTYEPTFSDVVGKYEGRRLPFIGRFVLFLQNPIGITTIFSLLYLLLMVDYFLKKLSKKENEKIDKFALVIGYNNLSIEYVEDNKLIEFNTIDIYYLEHLFKFNKDGFISKEKIQDEELRQNSKSNLIKVIHLDNEDVTFEIKINK